MKVFIITEGGQNFGFGHITRCISLYQAFEEQKIIPQLIVNGDDSVKDSLKDKPHQIFNWLKEKDKLFTLLKNADINIVDSYLADSSLYEALANLVKVPVYIDDTKRLDYPRGIVVNGSIYAERTNYPRKEEITYLLTTKYVPLQKEFWSIPEKIISSNLENILITFGGNDAKNMTQKILNFLNREYCKLKKIVVISKGFKNIKKIEDLQSKNTNLIYYPDTKTMKELMLNSDIAISAGGQTLYELARIGVPTIGICMAKNQEKNLNGWQMAGFIDYIGWYNNNELQFVLKQSIANLISSEERTSRSKIGKALVDGKGASRIVNAIMRKMVNPKCAINENCGIKFRKAKRDDCYDLWIWRNHPRTRKWSFNTEEIEYEKHREWFQQKMKDKSIHIYIAENKKGEKVGQIRFEINNNTAYTNVNLNSKFLGKGFGSEIIKKGNEFFIRDNPTVKMLVAEIIDGHIASKRAFQKAGYTFSHNIFKGNIQVAIFKLEV